MPLTYSPKLARHVISARHKWLLIKKSDGDLSRVEQSELIKWEVKFEDETMVIESEDENSFNNLTEDELFDTAEE